MRNRRVIAFPLYFFAHLHAFDDKIDNSLSDFRIKRSFARARLLVFIMFPIINVRRTIVRDER
jgi:hypothetical protein